MAKIEILQDVLRTPVRATIRVMKVVVLYRPMSEHGRAVETFIHDFKVRNSAANLEEINVDSSEGTALVSLYDIVQYPAILVLTGDGALLNSWQGTELPLINEVAAYAYGG